MTFRLKDVSVKESNVIGAEKLFTSERKAGFYEVSG